MFELHETIQKEISHVESFKNLIALRKGNPTPSEAVELLGFMVVYYANMMERYGKSKAMRDELFAKYLDTPEMSIGKAEGLAKGSEFGQKATFYENTSAGYLEIINALKKIMEQHNQIAKNQY